MIDKNKPTTTRPTWRAKFSAARISYNYCSICGHTPTGDEQPNAAPLRYWDPDDGWKIGTLCRWCAEDCLETEPKPTDYAYSKYYDPPEINTDEDPIEALI